MDGESPGRMPGGDRVVVPGGGFSVGGGRIAQAIGACSASTEKIVSSFREMRLPKIYDELHRYPLVHTGTNIVSLFVEMRRRKT